MTVCVAVDELHGLGAMRGELLGTDSYIDTCIMTLPL